MTPSSVKIWSKSPAIRFLLPLIAGIILQWNLQIKVSLLLTPAIILLVLLVGYNVLQVLKRFRYKSVNGIIIQLLFLFIGALLVYKQDIRKDPAWFGYQYENKDYLRVSLEEPLVEKPNSFKAVASVKSVYNRDSSIPSEGKLIIYFKKDSSLIGLGYGSHLLIHQPVAPIQNSGNPGAFDYKRFCLFDNGITHQVYLAPDDYTVLPGSDKAYLESLLFKSRANTIDILKRNIHGEKEQGLAEALLIGYKYDLDKNLLQAYSNTGVVHIIAISGLHLALIYGLLVFATRFLGRRKLYWLRIGIILLGIWSFTLLAGAQPSVLRAAVMFSFIGLGELLGRKTSIYNSLALSAFVLLIVNPFFLWDVGFQLSYAAVFSIVVFFRPIYNWFYFKNKLIDSIWKLNAVTIAAQLFTLPISIYHSTSFHCWFLSLIW
ncbi:MAG TPA: ComEC/Rec2 family competence protein [Chitinophagaceae bacterium]